MSWGQVECAWMVGKCEHLHACTSVHSWVPKRMPGLACGTLPSFVEAEMNAHSGARSTTTSCECVCLHKHILREEIARIIVDSYVMPFSPPPTSSVCKHMLWNPFFSHPMLRVGGFVVCAFCFWGTVLLYSCGFLSDSKRSSCFCLSNTRNKDARYYVG